MKRFKKVYLEITNICNLKCSFCPDTSRAKKFMTRENFCTALDKLRPYTDFIYFHLMGEPLLHPELSDFIGEATGCGYKVCLTTNGTLLNKVGKVLLEKCADNAVEIGETRTNIADTDCESKADTGRIHKISISLQAKEANETLRMSDSYLDNCFAFGKAAEGKMIVSYRLWNEGGACEDNEQIISRLKEYFPEPWKEDRQGYRIGEKVFLEFGETFEWPDLNAEMQGTDESRFFCYGLRDQLGVLCDGTVVPCCLDHDGDLALGNIFTDSMEGILQSERAQNIYNGFTAGKAVEELCRKCGYATRFMK